MFGCSRKALRQRRTCPVEMRKTRVEMCIGKAARPLPPVCLGSGERIAVFGGVPVVELVDGQGLPRVEQHTVGAGGQAGVEAFFFWRNFFPWKTCSAGKTNK